MIERSVGNDLIPNLQVSARGFAERLGESKDFTALNRAAAHVAGRIIDVGNSWLERYGGKRRVSPLQSESPVATDQVVGQPIDELNTVNGNGQTSPNGGDQPEFKEASVEMGGEKPVVGESVVEGAGEEVPSGGKESEVAQGETPGEGLPPSIDEKESADEGGNTEGRLPVAFGKNGSGQGGEGGQESEDKTGAGQERGPEEEQIIEGEYSEVPDDSRQRKSGGARNFFERVRSSMGKRIPSLPAIRPPKLLVVGSVVAAGVIGGAAALGLCVSKKIGSEPDQRPGGFTQATSEAQVLPDLGSVGAAATAETVPVAAGATAEATTGTEEPRSVEDTKPNLADLIKRIDDLIARVREVENAVAAIQTPATASEIPSAVGETPAAPAAATTEKAPVTVSTFAGLTDDEIRKIFGERVVITLDASLRPEGFDTVNWAILRWLMERIGVDLREVDSTGALDWRLADELAKAAGEANGQALNLVPDGATYEFPVNSRVIELVRNANIPLTDIAISRLRAQQ